MDKNSVHSCMNWKPRYNLPQFDMFFCDLLHSSVHCTHHSLSSYQYSNSLLPNVQDVRSTHHRSHGTQLEAGREGIGRNLQRRGRSLGHHHRKIITRGVSTGVPFCLTLSEPWLAFSSQCETQIYYNTVNAGVTKFFVCYGSTKTSPDGPLNCEKADAHFFFCVLCFCWKCQIWAIEFAKMLYSTGLSTKALVYAVVTAFRPSISPFETLKKYWKTQLSHGTCAYENIAKIFDRFWFPTPFSRFWSAKINGNITNFSSFTVTLDCNVRAVPVA